MEAPVQPSACCLSANSGRQRGGKQKLGPNHICPCPPFSSQTGGVATPVQSMRAVTYFTNFHVSGAVYKTFCDGGYGPSLAALRASADVYASWVINTRR